MKQKQNKLQNNVKEKEKEKEKEMCIEEPVRCPNLRAMGYVPVGNADDWKAWEETKRKRREVRDNDRVREKYNKSAEESVTEDSTSDVADEPIEGEVVDNSKTSAMCQDSHQVMPEIVKSYLPDSDSDSEEEEDLEKIGVVMGEAPAIDIEGDEVLLTPEMAQFWQQLTFQQFVAAVPVKRFRGLDREAWTAFAVHKEKQFDMKRREERILKSGSVFAKHLAENWSEELKLPVLPSKLNLPNILRDLNGDDHPKAAEVYITLSRGAMILPAEVAAKMEASEVENYRPKTNLLARQRTEEVQRHFDEGYVANWDDLVEQYGEDAVGQPVNIHAFDTVPKNESVCRLTLDATNAGNSKKLSVNDSTPKELYPVHYPKYLHVTAAMSPTGNIARADDTDAFLLTPLRPSQYRHACCRDPRTNKIIAFRRLPLGFTSACNIQQNTLVAHIRAFRRLLRKRGLRTAGDDPVYERPWTYTKPNPKGHELSASPGYTDDVALVTTSWASGYFSLIIFLMLKYEWGIGQGFKPGKTDPPAVQALWIGFLFNCRKMTLALHQERLDKMKIDIMPFAGKAIGEDRTIADARSLLGVLNFACAVILLGKAFMAHLYSVVQIADKEAKGLKAANKTIFKGNEETHHTANMWMQLLETMSVRSAMIGIRRKKFPFPAFSDASFTGWCWACMGIVKAGFYPKSWAARIGHHSEYKDIFITELETLCVALMAREIFPRCKHMIFEGFADNIGTVFMLNKFSTKSKRIRPIVEEILWRAVVYDVEISYDYIPTYRNCLTDAGTRLKDKNFQLHIDAFRSVHSPKWTAEAERQFPIQQPARPELLKQIPTVHQDLFDSLEISLEDLSELKSIESEWRTRYDTIAANNTAAAAAAFSQDTGTKRS